MRERAQNALYKTRLNTISPVRLPWSDSVIPEIRNDANVEEELSILKGRTKYLVSKTPRSSSPGNLPPDVRVENASLVEPPHNRANFSASDGLSRSRDQTTQEVSNFSPNPPVGIQEGTYMAMRDHDLDVVGLQEAGAAHQMFGLAPFPPPTSTSQDHVEDVFNVAASSLPVLPEATSSRNWLQHTMSHNIPSQYSNESAPQPNLWSDNSFIDPSILGNQFSDVSQFFNIPENLGQLDGESEEAWNFVVNDADTYMTSDSSNWSGDIFQFRPSL